MKENEYNQTHLKINMRRNRYFENQHGCFVRI